MKWLKIDAWINIVILKIVSLRFKQKGTCPALDLCTSLRSYFFLWILMKHSSNPFLEITKTMFITLLRTTVALKRILYKNISLQGSFRLTNASKRKRWLTRINKNLSEEITLINAYVLESTLLNFCLYLCFPQVIVAELHHCSAKGKSELTESNK